MVAAISSDPRLVELVTERATCPFVASALAQGELLVLGPVPDSLARVDDLRALGNSGGGDLGELMAVFAINHHAWMRGPTSRLDAHVPSGLFSLDFPGSQGSHPGHSGILMSDPLRVGSGRWSESDFERLKSHSADGLLARSSVAEFIAENVFRDRSSRVLQPEVQGTIAAAMVRLLLTANRAALASAASHLPGFPDVADATWAEVGTTLVTLLTESNLVASAGEFSLLFAFLAGSPQTKMIDGELALWMPEVEAMFRHKRLPSGWKGWAKTRLRAVTDMEGLVREALLQYIKLR